MTLWPWRLHFTGYPGYRFALRRGGRATPWPWTELAVPGIGSFIVSRAFPRTR